jgi:hypothetical protein
LHDAPPTQVINAISPHFDCLVLLSRATGEQAMRIFLSYHTPDFARAQSLKRAVETASPDVEVFFAPENLKVGQFWMPQLGESIAAAEAFLLLIGDRLGPYQEIEYYAGLDRHARDRGFAIVPVLMGKSAPGLPFLNQIHWIEAPAPHAEPALSRIVAALRGGAIEKGGELWRAVNPYRGLEALREQDAAFFFGREAETAAVLDAIAGGERRIITVVGNSGFWAWRERGRTRSPLLRAPPP